MTAADRFDRLFADMLADVAQPAFPDYIDDVLDVATRGTQRPTWMFPERWLPMRTLTRSIPFAPGVPWRNLGVLALIALLVAAIVAIAIGTQRQPAPPYGLAANGVIAYHVDGEIYSRSLDGSAPRLIVSGPELDVAPLFSLDGTRVAFARINRDQEGIGTAKEQASLMVANADGSDVRPLLGPTIFQDYIWSPDSRSLVVTGPGRAGRVLTIVPIDGSGPRELTEVRGIVSNVVPRPPDGRELIVQLSARGRAQFFSVTLDTGAVRQISHDDSVVQGGILFAITPDGKQLVYEHGGDEMDLRILDIATGDERIFGTNLPPLAEFGVHAGHPIISSDGTQLVFGRWWDWDGEMMNHQMWTASLTGDGSDARPIGSMQRTPGGRLPYFIALAPDGSRVIVHRLETSETWSTDLTGGNLQNFDFGEFEDIDWQRRAP